MISVRQMLEQDIEDIAADARQADLDEIEEGCGVAIREALLLGWHSSVAPMVIAWGDVPLAAFGEVSHSPGAGIGLPWLVSTNAIEKHARPFLRICKPLVQQMLERHIQLINFVDARNLAAIRWLEWLGFTMEEAAPYGPHGLPFRKFHLSREQ